VSFLQPKPAREKSLKEEEDSPDYCLSSMGGGKQSAYSVVISSLHVKKSERRCPFSKCSYLEKSVKNKPTTESPKADRLDDPVWDQRKILE